ncbi:MAG: hypothetical protein H9893_04720 [Candidatus Niameybacter stercoravium]|nr:hypothetical protein [Candidatus Niameybacter stercoravium]
MDYSNVPIELKRMNRWVLYRIFLDAKTGKYTKKPFNARTGGMAQSNNPSTWSDYDTAMSVVMHYAGLGFMLGDGIFGVDIDGVEIEDPVVNEVITTLGSYAEVSPSGKGIHVICKGSKPQGACRKGNFECYDKGRFFTMTGKVIKPYTTLRDCTDSIKPLLDKYLKKEETKRPTSTLLGSNQFESLSDSEVLEKASKHSKFNDLYYYGWGCGDASRDDMALVDYLIFWTGGSSTQIDRLFRESALMRSKWDRRQSGRTYGEITINKCLSTYTGGFYNPHYYKGGAK